MTALCFLFVCVLLAAMIARKIRDNVLAPSARRVASHSRVALRLQLSKRRLRGLDLAVKIHTMGRPAKRSSEQEHILVAVGPIRFRLNAMKLRIGLAHVIFDAGKLVLSGIWRAVRQLRLKLPATGIGGTEGRRLTRAAIGGLSIDRAWRRLVVGGRPIAAAPWAAASTPTPALGETFICPCCNHSQGAKDGEAAKKSSHVTRRRSKIALPDCSPREV